MAKPMSDDEMGLELELIALDNEYKHARSPKARRRIEQKIAAVKAEQAKIDELGKKVDVTFQRWITARNPTSGSA
jgi:hypothetical protein